MKKRIAVTWQMCGYIDVDEVNTTAEAMKKFSKDPEDFPFPVQKEYVDGSYQLSTDDVEVMEMMCEVQ